MNNSADCLFYLFFTTEPAVYKPTKNKKYKLLGYKYRNYRGLVLCNYDWKQILLFEQGKIS